MRAPARHWMWIPQVLLAIAIAPGGLLKIIGDPLMVDMFAAIGAGQWLRYAVGLLEVAGAVGLLVPRLAAPAGFGLAALLVGAAVTNVAVLGQAPALPLAYAVMAAAVCWARRPGARAARSTPPASSTARA